MAKACASIVMIVGADSDFTYLMQYYAKKSGHQAVVSSPGKEALAFARREKPAVIILEADLADAASWDVVQELKADQVTRHIPVVVCSWLDEETNRRAEGVACYLQKPILYDDFVTALVDVRGRVEPNGGDSV